jgi:hypothetical protein
VLENNPWEAQGVSKLESVEEWDGLGAPACDLTRSMAAKRVGELASESQLFMANYEHRVQLPVPEHWNPSGRDDMSIATEWKNGVLPESKYAVFRHDLMLGSLHPMHRGKWTAHELCHGLIGFGWKKDGDILFNSLSARLAEILPVALWYFFDEEGLKRCPKHEGQGPLGREFCVACETAASLGPAQKETSGEWLSKGVDYVMGELAAVRESRRTGEAVHYPHDVVDLASDSVSYALAHAHRIASEEFELFTDLFFKTSGGHHATLDSLEARVLEVMAGIVEGKAVTPLGRSKWAWVGQDIGWRLLTVASECDDEMRQRLFDVVADLAASPGAESVIRTFRSYEAMVAEYQLPPSVEVFSVGYSLPLGYGRSARQVSEGIISACPGTSQLLTWRGDDLVESFLRTERPQRLPIGRRFAEFLAIHGHGELASVARFEAALIYPPGPDRRALWSVDESKNDLLRLGDYVELIDARFDFIRLADMLRQGRPGQPIHAATHVAVGRQEDGDAFIAEMSLELFGELTSLRGGPRPRREVRISEHELSTLKECGILEVVVR